MELAGAIGEVLQTNTLKKMEALKLRGRMQFTAGQLFGRVARKCLSVITQHAYHAESATVSPSAASALARFRDMLVASAPRVISSKNAGNWFVFTDASHEPQADRPYAGIGAVLVDNRGNKQRFFSQRLDDELLIKINVSLGKTFLNVIFLLYFVLYSFGKTSSQVAMLCCIQTMMR